MREGRGGGGGSPAPAFTCSLVLPYFVPFSIRRLRYREMKIKTLQVSLKYVRTGTLKERNFRLYGLWHAKRMTIIMRARASSRPPFFSGGIWNTVPPSLARIIMYVVGGDLAIRPPWVLLPWPSNPPLPYSLCATHLPPLPAAHFFFNPPPLLPPPHYRLLVFNADASAADIKGGQSRFLRQNIKEEGEGEGEGRV